MKDYESTVMRIAGNLLSGRCEPTWDGTLTDDDRENVIWAVAMARAIVAETHRTKPDARETP